MRKSGILLHISSLDGKYGIGDFGPSAYTFVDKLFQAKQSYWQILPIGPTSYQDSPYQSFSSYAINPYFISLDLLLEEKYLEKEDLENIKNDLKVDYGYLFETRLKTLFKAFVNFKENAEYLLFIKEEKAWLDDYSLFMALKKHFAYQSFDKWPCNIKKRKKETILVYQKLLEEEIRFHKFLQYMGFKQWRKLKKYANDKNILIIGDLPIYVSYDSACVWSNAKYYQLDSNLSLKYVAGVPPDMFSPKGQVWGNPLYNWKKIKNDKYLLWINKINHASQMFDVVRLDHFIGFVRYYQIDYNDVDASKSIFVKGPGYALFKHLYKHNPSLKIIAEDLGLVTKDVIKLMNKLSFPGMRVLQFGFDGKSDNPHITHNHLKNQVIYTATHDNDTTKSWINLLNENELTYLKTYVNEINNNYLIKALIKEAFKSIADTVIIPLQDLLELDTFARMNFPAKEEGNWQWRYQEKDFNDEVINFLIEISKIYQRNQNN